MIPERYKFLESIGTLPKMVNAALQFLGVKEIPGNKSNPIILNMAKELGIGDIYTNDDTSWCALFINYLMLITGKPMVHTGGDKYNLLRAKWLVNWGTHVPIGEEKLGDIAIFERPGGGHVAIVIAITPSTIVVLGGNQNNAVTITEMPKSREIAVRRYYSIAPPASAIAYHIDSSGHISTNEA